MLTFERQFECAGNLVTVRLREDGVLEMDGRDEVCEAAMVEMGLEPSICIQIWETWNSQDGHLAVVMNDLSDDLRATWSTCADALEQAYRLYFRKFSRRLSAEYMLHSVSRTIGITRDLVDARTSDPVDWTKVPHPDVVAKLRRDVRDDENAASKEATSHCYSSVENIMLSVIYNALIAARLLCDSLSKHDLIPFNQRARALSENHMGAWSLIHNDAWGALGYAARAIAFAESTICRRTGSPNRDLAINWIIGRFVRGCHELEASRPWPEVKS